METLVGILAFGTLGFGVGSLEFSHSELSASVSCSGI
jgi:hypothetical protein